MDDAFYKQDTLTDLASPRQDPPSIPAQVGPYKIESLLSRGGMSILYLGLHPRTKEPLAIKVLSPEYVTHPEMIQRFLKEAEIIKMTDHPNIVKLYGEGQWEGGLYIAMELIRGVSLRQFIFQQSLSLKRLIDIILQVAYALCHLHSHGVIHGDLKPENILITEDGEVKVIDFGIARLHEEIKRSSAGSLQIAGTPNYMSPEQKEDPSKISFASDIYALGVIAYELAMGKLSYGVIHLSLVPKGLRPIIEKALAISVKERYQDIVLFITDLSQYLKSGGLEKDKPGSDQMKEMMEVLQRSSQSLSPAQLPSWPEVELGLAKYKGPGQIGSFYDLLKQPDQSYVLLLAESLSVGLESGIFIAVLRGMIRSLFQTKYERPAAFAAHLNKLVSQDPIGQKFSLALLFLNPFRDTLAFVSCGLGSLIHAPSAIGAPRKLSNYNPALGSEPNAEFFETSDNWHAGDTLIFHSLDAKLEGPLLESLSENMFLSPQGQAEALLKKAASQPSFSQQKNPKTLLSVHRNA